MSKVPTSYPRRPRSHAEAEPLLLWSDAAGQIVESTQHLVAARSGLQLVEFRAHEWSPLPDGAVLQYLPLRAACAFERGTSQPVVLAAEGRRGTARLAVAAQLPNGWSRTLLPAYETLPGAPTLPFFGYAAVCLRGDDLWVAAIQTEDNLRWSTSQYSTPDLARLVKRRLKGAPGNRLLAHHAHCALDYQCYNAQNIFYRRWEAAIAVSAACNSRCRGCISLQPDDMPPSPQERLDFVPTLDEILEIGVDHLEQPEAILSFGQGCEGEPLLKGELIARSIAALRQRCARGTIHINTNASLPHQVQRLVDAGLDSIRISLNSVHPDRYTAYYQPQRYTFDDVVESARICRDAGVQIALNLLYFPGVNDLADEIERLEAFVKEYQVHQVQMRNLNIDPELYLSTQPPLDGDALGVVTLVERLRALCAVGNATLPRARPRLERTLP